MKRKKEYLELTKELGTSVPSSKFEPMDELGTRINAVINLLGGSKSAAKIADLSKDQLDRYISGSSKPGFAPIARMAIAAKVNMEWIWTGEGSMHRNEQLTVQEEEQGVGLLDAFALVPIYDVEVSAGPGREVIEEEPTSELAFRRDWLADMGLHVSKCVAVKARGDSMSPTIEDGDVLLVDRTVPDGRRDGIYIMSQQGTLRVKRVQWLSDGNVRLGSDNTAYAEELVYGEGVRRLNFVGRVVWGGRRF